jgi:hypothetical protein
MLRDSTFLEGKVLLHVETLQGFNLKGSCKTKTFYFYNKKEKANSTPLILRVLWLFQKFQRQ